MDDICPTCGEDAKLGKPTCDDPMCNAEYALYILTTFKVVPASKVQPPSERAHGVAPMNTITTHMPLAQVSPAAPPLLLTATPPQPPEPATEALAPV